MIKNRIKKLRQKFKNLGIDGYIIPKNDEFFSEYAENDRLKNMTNFTGSAGLAIILKKKIIYLLMEGTQFKHKMKQVKILQLLKFIKNYPML